MNITIFGKGNMGSALSQAFSTNSANKVTTLSHEDNATLGDIVILAVPYPAIDDIIDRYATQLDGKIIIDITNPLDFSTFDRLVVPADQSVAQELQRKLPEATLVKGFNTNFAATLATTKVADTAQTTVLLASDSSSAKDSIQESLKDSDLAVIDAGSLKRARELEAIGFLQLTLAAREQIGWTGGFSLHN